MPHKWTFQKLIPLLNILSDLQIGLRVFDNQVTKKVIKWAERLPVPMESPVFDGKEQVSIIWFQYVFEVACDDNCIHKQVQMWRLHTSTRD